MTDLRCIDPSVGEAVRDAARSSQTMSRVELRHVDSCAGCRVSVERTRRQVATYRDAQPSASDVAEARIRFAAWRARHQRRPAQRWHLVPRAITVALLLALVATAAAQIAARHDERVRAEQKAQALLAAKPTHHHSHRHHAIASDVGGDARDSERSSGVPAQSVPATESAVPAESPEAAATPAAQVSAPGLHAKRIAHHAAPSAEHPAVTAVEPAAAPTTSSPPAPAPESSSSWEGAAAALRAGDQARAERALTALAEATDPRTRDAARLARAQLWMSQGRFERARSDLQQLASTGITALIRQRAGEALNAFR